MADRCVAEGCDRPVHDVPADAIMCLPHYMSLPNSLRAKVRKFQRRDLPRPLAASLDKCQRHWRGEKPPPKPKRRERAPRGWPT